MNPNSKFHKYIRVFLSTLLVFVLPVTKTFAQEKGSPLYFISDCQLPLSVEKILLKPHKNKEGRDSLFKDIERENQGYVFMLGDIVGKSSDNRKWSDVDAFLRKLHSDGSLVYAIPGNHEYLFNASSGIANYSARFPGLPIDGYCVRTDSMAIVMLNSNFKELSPTENNKQQRWYLAVMDSLDADTAVKFIIVCAHHSPYSNSKVVGASSSVQSNFVKRYETSAKTKLFISGHSHNLEYFASTNNKHYLVIGGGGGIAQPLYKVANAKYQDLIKQEEKPLFFYLVLQRNGNGVEIRIRGYSKALTHTPEIKIDL